METKNKIDNKIKLILISFFLFKNFFKKNKPEYDKIVAIIIFI